MPYPTSPDVSTSYTAFEQSQGDGSFPGQELDVDLAAVRASIAATIEFLKGVTRSDGKLGNQTVGREQLATDVLLGFGAPTTWTTGAVYKATNTVFNGTGFYLCNVDHTAGDFATDLAAGRWTLLADINASGALIVGNNLSDLGDAAAARTNLGLGAVAQDNTVPVSRGGTGATDAAGARTALGLGNAVTGTAGTAGQVATWNADGDVDGTPVATIVSTANVGAAAAGLAYDAIGSLAFAYFVPQIGVNPGATHSGENLYPASASGRTTATPLTGAWRCLGFLSASGTTIEDFTTLWIRVA